jgi:hypothetical protein
VIAEEPHGMPPLEDQEISKFRVDLAGDRSSYR